MKKNIYHGSSRIVRSPGFGTGNAYNDFGLGFYCFESAEAAACAASSNGLNGFVSAYSIETDGLRIINLCSSQYTPLHWLYLLFSFREFGTVSPLAHRSREYINKYYSVDFQGCDCIIGYRADNSCFSFAGEFAAGRMSYQALRAALTHTDSNRQFVLKSNRAFDRISFAGYEPSVSAVCTPAFVAKELQAIRRFGSAGPDGLYIDQLIEEDIKPYDLRLQ